MTKASDFPVRTWFIIDWNISSRECIVSQLVIVEYATNLLELKPRAIELRKVSVSVLQKLENAYFNFCPPDLRVRSRTVFSPAWGIGTMLPVTACSTSIYRTELPNQTGHSILARFVKITKQHTLVGWTIAQFAFEGFQIITYRTP